MPLLIFKALNNLAPNYICSKINMARNSHSHNTRGAAKSLVRNLITEISVVKEI